MKIKLKINTNELHQVDFLIKFEILNRADRDYSELEILDLRAISRRTDGLIINHEKNKAMATFYLSLTKKISRKPKIPEFTLNLDGTEAKVLFKILYSLSNTDYLLDYQLYNIYQNIHKQLNP